MSKNIVKIILERKMNIEENVIDSIMDFHGDIDKMLPKGYFPKSIKNCLRIKNWRIEFKFYQHPFKCKKYIIININKNNLWNVFNNGLHVTYRYPFRYGDMAGTQQIEKIDDGLIKFKDNRVSLKLERLDVIEIWYEYKWENYD